MTIHTLSFTKLQEGYSRKSQPAVWKAALGGTSAYSWLKGGDSCTVRLSMALHRARHEIRPVPGAKRYQGNDKRWYLIRADEVARKYFPKVFQSEPDVSLKSRDETKLRSAIRGRKGVVFFRLWKTHKGEVLLMDRFGHADLWDGSAVHYGGGGT